MLVATLFSNYNAADFDLDIVMDTSKRMVITHEDAKQWAEAEMRKDRSRPEEWEITESDYHGKKTTTYYTPKNQDGYEEEWVLFVEDVPFWKP